jgi:hypothetical protein
VGDVVEEAVQGAIVHWRRSVLGASESANRSNGWGEPDLHLVEPAFYVVVVVG